MLFQSFGWVVRLQSELFLIDPMPDIIGGVTASCQAAAVVPAPCEGL